MEISTIDPCTGPEWDHLAASHPDATFFHGSSWAKVLRQTYRHDPNYLLITERGAIRALLPLMGVKSWLTGPRGVALPFTDACAPLLFAGADFRSMLSSILEFVRPSGWKHLEIRGRVPGIAPSVEFHSHRLDLRPGAQALFARLHGSIRQGIRKAEQCGVSVGIERSEEAMHEFYALHMRTRRRHGVPPQPYRFFETIQREVLDPAEGFIAVARHGGKPAAASVYFRKRDAAIYKFGASDETMQHTRANTLVMWRAIETLAAERAKSLDLGRTSLFSAGLRRFKKHWGGEETRLAYTRLDATTGAPIPALDKATGWHNRCFHALPERVSRLAGAILYPHLD